MHINDELKFGIRKLSSGRQVTVLKNFKVKPKQFLDDGKIIIPIGETGKMQISSRFKCFKEAVVKGIRFVISIAQKDQMLNTNKGMFFKYEQ